MNPRKLAVGIAAILAFCLAIPARAQIAGFGGTGVNWSLNNDPNSQSVPAISNDVLLLGTTKDDATSAFYVTPQYIGSFTVSFVWQNAAATDQAGFVFAMQNEGTNAVGEVGGNYLGYVGMNLATGIAFNINNGNGAQPGLGYAPMQVPGGGANGYIATGNVNFHATNPIAVSIGYASDVLNITVTDTVTSATFSTNIVEDLTAAVGGSTAFVGFTGGGTAVLNVSVSNFVFTPGTPPPAPTSFPAVLSIGTNLDVTKLSGNESDGVIAYNPLNPGQLFIVANTNVEAGLFAATCTNGVSGTNITNIAVGNLTPVSLANLPAGAYPAVAWDGYGNLFLAYADGSFSGIDVAVSTNGGKNFALLTKLAVGHFALEPRIAAGPGNSTGGAGTNAGSVWVLYKDYSLAYAPLVAQGAAVTNMGTNNLGTNAVGTFGFGQIIPGSTNDCGFGDIAVGPQGQVMVAYQNLFNSSGTANCFVSVNANGLGASFASPVLAAANTIGGNTIIPASPDGQGINAAVGLAWDANPASEQYGRVYLACVGQGSGDASDTDIFLTSSTDSGAIWSSEVEVNDDGGQNSKFLPRVAVDPTSGAVALSWYDCRNDTGGPISITSYQTNYGMVVTNDPTDNPPTDFSTNYTTNYITGDSITNVTTSTSTGPSPTTNQAAMIYATVSLNGGFTFQPNVKVTGDSTTGYVAPPAGSPTDFGDYTGLAFYGGTFYPVWADNSTNNQSNPDRTNNTFDVMMAPVTLSGLADVSIRSVVVNPTNYTLPQTNLLQIGSLLDYFLTVSNNGPSAVSAAYVTNVFPTNVSVVIAFPTNTNNAIIKGNYVLHGNTLVWPVGKLPVKGTATILVETTAVGIGNATNFAMITPGTGVADVLTNNNATNMVTVISGANLYLSIASSPTEIGYGAPDVVYTVTVTNQGPVPATGVLISNVFSTNLAVVGVNAAGYSCTTNVSQNSVTINIGPMTNGQTVTVSLTNVAPTNFASAGFALAICSSSVLGLINTNSTNISAIATVPIVTPDLAIGMTGTPAIMAVGDTVTYTLYVTNLGPVPAFGVVIANALPPDLQFASTIVRKGTYTTSPDPVISGQTDISVAFSEPLAVGERTEVIITATALSIGTAPNVAVVGDVAVDLIPANNTAQVATPVLPPDMALGMTGSPAYIAVGDTVTYTLFVTNLGPVIARGIVLTNALPPSLRLAAVNVRKGISTNYPDPVISGQTDINAFFSEPLAVGASTEVIITATALSLGQATNVAFVYDSALDPNLANNSAQVVTPVLSAEMVIGMTGSTNYVPIGGSVTYTLIVTNWGPVNGHNVLVTNVLPTNLVFAAASVSAGSYTTGPDPVVAGATDIIASLGTMAAGQTATLTITATAAGLGNATNVAVVYDNEVNPNLVNNNAQVVTAVLAPDVAVGMIGSPSSITVGQQVIYVMTVTNLGPVIAKSVVVSNTLPANLSYVSAFAALGITFTQSQNEVVFQIGTMTNGQRAVMTVTAAATGLGNATNIAVIYDSQPNTNFNGSAQVVTPVVAPDVALGMTGSPSTVFVGQNVTYTLSLTNNGPPSALAVAVTNTLPANVVFEGTTLPMGVTYTASQNTIIFNIGTMTNGQTETLGILALASSAGEATNTAIVGDTLEDTTYDDDIASAVTTITNAPEPFDNLTVVPGVTGVFVTWSSPSNSSSQVFYGLTPAAANYSWLNPLSTNYHVVLLTGLAPDTNYYFQAVSIISAMPGSYTTNGTVVTYTGGTSAVTNSTNGTFSTTSTVFMQTTDAAFTGPGWAPSGLGNGIYSYANTYVYDSVRGVSGAPTASATYTPNIPVPGLYDVSVWYPMPSTGNAGFSSNTPMSAVGATNLVSTNINQAVNGGSWQTLATGLFFATNGYTGNLTILNNSGDPTTSVVANGARWSYELSQDAPTNGSVPAWWSSFYFTNSVSGSVSGTNDASGDGYSNFANYVLGTDPVDRSLELQFTVTPGPSTNVTVGFAPFMGGRMYQLLAATNLQTPAWVTLTSTAAQNTNDGSGYFTVGAAAGGKAAFYRLAVTLSTNQ